MEKVLITGASGSLGILLIKYLLEKNKYEITALDLNCKENKKKLKKFRKKITIYYHDLDNQAFIDSIIKDFDYVIHLAGVALPLSNLSKSFGKEIDFKCTNNIVRSITYYNPDCFLIYPSTTSLYEKSSKPISLRSTIKYSSEDYYSQTKKNCEDLIKTKLNNYIIFRFPFILNEEIRSIYLYQKNEEIEIISNYLAAKILGESLEAKEKLNKKIKLASGGKKYRINSSELFLKTLDIYGFSWQFLWNKLFNPYRYHGNIYTLDKTVESILNNTQSLEDYLSSLKKKKRILGKFLAFPLKKSLERSIRK